MQLIELVVELSDHLLDVRTFLLGVDLLEHGDLHILLRKEALLHKRVEGFLLEHILDLGVPVTA